MLGTTAITNTANTGILQIQIFVPQTYKINTYLVNKPDQIFFIGAKAKKKFHDETIWLQNMRLFPTVSMP